MTDTITLPRAVVQGALEALESSDESSCDEFVAAIDALREALEQQQAEPVYGDVLPPVGSRVFIRHGRDDDAHACIVTGYYAWPDLKGDKRLHRVFVRMVYEGTDTEQARMLCDCYPSAEAALAPKPALEQPQQTVSMAEYKRLQDLVTSQGIRLMEYESEPPQGEPMAWMTHESQRRLKQGGNCKGAVPVHGKPSATAKIPLYTAPPRRKWVGLNSKEVYELESTIKGRYPLIRAVQAKLREKNA